MYKELLKAVTNFGSPKVLLVGDFILDSYVYGDALRISPEAPVAVLKVVERKNVCGGAGSVAMDLAELGADCFCVGVVGNDSNAETLINLLAAGNADTAGMIKVDDRVTVTKQRLVGLAQHRHRQQLLRIDDESDEPLTENVQRDILNACKAKLNESDIVCLQDYDKGTVSKQLCEELIKPAKEAGKKVLVDPAMIKDYSRYKGASVITPNRYEASIVAGFEIETTDDAKKAADIISEKYEIEVVIITMDKEGAYLKAGDISELVPTIPRNVYDVTGAGDMVLAMLAVSVAAGCDFPTAVHLANIAGGLEVEKFGTATVSVDEVVNEIISINRSKMGKVRSVEALIKELAVRRGQKETIVFTNGCFDVLHRGHIEYLRFCKDQGDVLVLGLNSDSSVRQIKGPKRPINNQHDRAAVLAALETIDYIVVFDEADPLNLIKKVNPDVLVKGADWAQKGVVGREFVESQGGKVVLAPLVDGKSSTNTIEKMKELERENDG